MQILTECLLKWDTKTQSSKGKGILGTVIAFAGADEEQGRKTLHRHWQIWVKEIDQNIRDCLFHKDDKTRLEARDTFIKHIDDVLSADYGSDLYISHRCVQKDKNEELKIDIADNLLKEKKKLILDVRGTKNCPTKLREILCIALNVTTPYPQLI